MGKKIILRNRISVSDNVEELVEFFKTRNINLKFIDYV